MRRRDRRKVLRLRLGLVGRFGGELRGGCGWHGSWGWGAGGLHRPERLALQPGDLGRVGSPGALELEVLADGFFEKIAHRPPTA
ncbi:MAG: hypothetical protein DLM63_13000 [Solirubrobacterales bacterium]|nr:MAG: hypothetical protein DLM63_13000 [Solirubrobacterales bacterium]